MIILISNSIWSHFVLAAKQWWISHLHGNVRLTACCLSQQMWVVSGVLVRMFWLLTLRPGPHIASCLRLDQLHIKHQVEKLFWSSFMQTFSYFAAALHYCQVVYFVFMSSVWIWGGISPLKYEKKLLQCGVSSYPTCRLSNMFGVIKKCWYSQHKNLYSNPPDVLLISIGLNSRWRVVVMVVVMVSSWYLDSSSAWWPQAGGITYNVLLLLLSVILTDIFFNWWTSFI